MFLRKVWDSIWELFGRMNKAEKKIDQLTDQVLHVTRQLRDAGDKTTLKMDISTIKAKGK